MRIKYKKNEVAPTHFVNATSFIIQYFTSIRRGQTNRRPHQRIP